MKRLFGRIFPRGVWRNISVLVGGTAVAQALAVVVLPVLTRLYTPSDFGLLGVYIAVLSVLASISCLRLEIVIPMPRGDGEAANLLILACGFCFIVSLSLGIAVIFFPAQISRLIGAPELASLLWAIPVGLLGTGLYTALQFWSTREKLFANVSKAHIVRSSSGIVTQTGLGLAGMGLAGLILGQIMFQCGGILILLRGISQPVRRIFLAVRLETLKVTFSKYWYHVRYSSIEALCNTASIHVPIIIIAAMTSGAEVGFLMLSMKILAVPMALVGTSVAQVYLSEAPEKLRSGELTAFTAYILKKLLMLGVPLIAIIGISAPLIVPIAFGDAWSRSGMILAWMMPWFALQFLASPVSMALYVTGNQKTALYLQMFGFLLRSGLVVVTFLISEAWIVEAYAISGALFYGIYLIVVVRIVKRV